MPDCQYTVKLETEIERQKELLSKQLKQFGSFNPAVLETGAGLVSLFIQGEDYERAERACVRMLELASAIETSPAVNRVLAQYARVLTRLNRRQPAELVRSLLLARGFEAATKMRFNLN
jgi:hypothetical protein